MRHEEAWRSQRPGADAVRVPHHPAGQYHPGQVKPFEEVREDVAKELRHQQAENRFYEITQTLANLSYEHPDSLEPAAKALDVNDAGERLVQPPGRGRDRRQLQGG
jgi:hypothetical protein